MEPFELLLAACFVWTYNVHVFTQTWTRAFRVRTSVGRSVVQGVRAWRLGSSNVRDREQARERQRERERERERESPPVWTYTRESGKVAWYIQRRRERKGTERRREKAPELSGHTTRQNNSTNHHPPPANHHHHHHHQRTGGATSDFFSVSPLSSSLLAPFPLPFTLPPPPLAITLCSTL